MANWENVGKIQGERGEKGEQGEQGLPAIIESGSNDDGHFIKFSDGTMVVRTTMNVGTPTIGDGSPENPWRTPEIDYTWYFPVEFIDDDIQVFGTANTSSAQNSARQFNVAFRKPTKESIRNVAAVSVYPREEEITDEISIAIMAIGRWK